MSCPACGCDVAAGARAHALQAVLGDDDLDAAIVLGLLDAGIACSACTAACRDALQAARDTRLRALAMRERFRAREARLVRRRRERDERRTPIAAPDSSASRAMPALPPAAAAALARAKAKAARPRDR